MSSVVFTIGVLALAVIPQWQKSVARKREANVKAQLTSLRQAIQAFRQDTACYPASLTDLTNVTAPASCFDNSGNLISLPGDFRGPYVQYVPNAHLGTADHDISILYSTNSGVGHGVGSVYLSSSIGSNDTDGRAFLNY